MVTRKEQKAQAHYYTVAKKKHGSRFKGMDPGDHEMAADMFSTFAVKGSAAFCKKYGYPDSKMDPSQEEINNKVFAHARRNTGGSGGYVDVFYKFARNYTPEEADEVMRGLLSKYPDLAGLKNAHDDFRALVAKCMEKRGNSWAIKNKYR